MSDFYVSLIPTDVNWQPTKEAATEVETYVRRVFPDPDGVQQDVTVEFYDRITVVDAGENIRQITCPRCDQNIPLDWYGDLVEETEGEFDSLIVTVPCCETAVALDTLTFDWPSGFARFEIAVANPARTEYTFTRDEISAVEAILGHQLRQIVAHI
ncbi:hypothetical protein RMN56_02435 [Micromonospora halotolerans]|uniref:Uncharacterized protein n=1 Tax=Micromonospora halotolerans TaxID=709879 RepID=A0ABY9ZYJ2_9ACTN|nr:hypothetical protein [Micromonospora halotolerans]WNM40244.1 hypothetical protein RMN56_02435 [Micromonospora halotolerans]